MRVILFFGALAAVASVVALSTFYGMETPNFDLNPDDWWNHQ